ncbi:DUF3017 domain-containing protein [Nocardioides sp. B-3]|uniref:DUF3017 domain-containing protein n=1 Tax=Nocardioides sp. B-3 TaxID=2895565 RepID=UPI0021537156|nr:DUF3017 domain-containing protein [Nocardioides sp. B-3]UUZ57995.1 DUF3017 domain-containing protein [Nocardioides sp. B-3]
MDDRSPDQPDTGRIVPPESVPPISAEDLVDGDHPSQDREERRYPSTIGGAFYLLVLAVTVAGLAVASLSDWRIGIRIVGGALIFAAAVRTVPGPRDAGMLAVRHKALDVAVLVALGAALIFLTTSIPDQPGL